MGVTMHRTAYPFFVMALQLPTICEIVVVYCCFYMLVGHLELRAVVMVMCVYFVVLLILLIAPVC